MNDKIKLYQCPAYLFCNYELLDKTSSQIAEECMVHYTTILTWLRKFNIKIQPMSVRMSGKKNPMYGRTGENAPNYGKYWSEESKDKRRGKNAPMYGRTGKNHPKWKGDDVKSVIAKHNRVREIKPKPVDGKCEICHKVKDKYGKTKLELSNLKEHNYTLNPDEYQWAHHSCQLGWDAKRRKAKSKRNKKTKSKKDTNQMSYWLS